MPLPAFVRCKRVYRDLQRGCRSWDTSEWDCEGPSRCERSLSVTTVVATTEVVSGLHDNLAQFRFSSSEHKPDGPARGIAPMPSHPSLARRAWREPQVWTAQSQTVRFYLGGENGWNLILPVRVRARTEIFARTRLRMGYAASVAGRPAATEGPGGDSSGGATFRPGRSAKAVPEK